MEVLAYLQMLENRRKFKEPPPKGKAHSLECGGWRVFFQLFKRLLTRKALKYIAPPTRAQCVFLETNKTRVRSGGFPALAHADMHANISIPPCSVTYTSHRSAIRAFMFGL